MACSNKPRPASTITDTMFPFSQCSCSLHLRPKPKTRDQSTKPKPKVQSPKTKAPNQTPKTKDQSTKVQRPKSKDQRVRHMHPATDTTSHGWQVPSYADADDMEDDGHPLRCFAAYEPWPRLLTRGLYKDSTGVLIRGPLGCIWGIRAIINILDCRAISRMDVGFYIGLLFLTLRESLYTPFYLTRISTVAHVQQHAVEKVVACLLGQALPAVRDGGGSAERRRGGGHKVAEQSAVAGLNTIL